MCLGEILSHAKKEAWHELPHVKPIKRVFSLQQRSDSTSRAPSYARLL